MSDSTLDRVFTVEDLATRWQAPGSRRNRIRWTIARAAQLGLKSFIPSNDARTMRFRPADILRAEDIYAGC